jgi:hypothetical protein
LCFQSFVGYRDRGINIVVLNQDSTSSRLFPGSSYSCCIRNFHALVHKQCHKTALAAQRKKHSRQKGNSLSAKRTMGIHDQRTVGLHLPYMKVSPALHCEEASGSATETTGCHQG